MSASVAMPAVKQKRSKLAPTCCQASSTIVAGKTPTAVLDLSMALSPSWIQHPEPTGSRRATPTSHFQQRPGHLLAGLLTLYGSEQIDALNNPLQIVLG